MNPYNITIIIGSLRKESLNRKLAKAVVQLAPADFTFREASIAGLPLYNQDDEAAPGEEVARFKEKIKSSQGVLFVTPEYNRSMPGVLKNAIDHASRPFGQSAFAGKPAGIMGATMGVLGTALAQQHLRSVLAFLDMAVLGQPEAYIRVTEGFFDENGAIGGASRPFFEKWMERYTTWVRSHVG